MKEENFFTSWKYLLLLLIISIIFFYVLVLFIDYYGYDEQYSNFCKIKYNQSSYIFDRNIRLPFCIVLNEEGESFKQYYFSKEIAKFFCPNKFLSLNDC